MNKLWNTINAVKLIIIICIFILPIHAQQGDNTALNMVWHEADDIEYGRGYTLKVGMDIDEDGWGEMLVYERMNDSPTLYKISLFEADADNSYREVWFYQFDSAVIACGERGLMVTDLDNDGFSEITAIMCTIEGVDNLYVFEWDGKDIDGTPGQGLPATPTVTFDLPRDTGGVVALENNVQYLQMDDDANLEMVLTHRGGNSTFLQILELSNSDFNNPVWNVEFTDDWVGAKNTGFGITDIDHDGLKEIIMFDDYTGQVRVYENTGTDAYEVVGTWTPTPTGYVNSATVKSRIQALDYDNDGVDEIYFSDSRGILWILTPNGNVSTMFDNANWNVLHDWKLDGVEWNEGGEVRGCIPGDLDRDGKPDLYFAGNNYGAIMDMEYEGGSVTDEESYSFYYTTIDGATVDGGRFARPSNVALGDDMDNDGHLEVVAIVPWTGSDPVDNLRGLYVFEHDFGGIMAQFSGDVTYGDLPFMVTFTNLSVPGDTSIVSWDWDFGDGQTSTDQNPIHTYYNPGTYTVSLTVTDENGLFDAEVKVDYIEVFMPEIFISVIVDSVTAFSGDTIIVAVFVVFPTDSTFSSAGLSISGYQNALEFIEVDTTSTLIGSANWMFIVNETENLIITASAGAENISGEGVLFKLKFSVPDTISGFVPIIVVSALFDESDIPVTIISGGINIVELIAGDVSLNEEVTPYDASLILKYLVDYIVLDHHQLFNANISLDTTVSALDATLILQYYVGLIDTLPYDTTSGSLLASGLISMNDDEIQAGQSIVIPLFLSNGYNILSFETVISFNPVHLTFDEILWSQLVDGFTIENNYENGEIMIAGAGTVPDGEEGVFSTLLFTVNDNFNEDATTVTVQSLRWNEEPVMENIATATLSNVLSVGNENTIPEQFALHQNYPNPFNPVTTISYQLPKAAFVNLSIYNLSGQLVETLVNYHSNAGFHTVEWNARGVGSGLYFYRIEAGEYRETKKCLILK